MDETHTSAPGNRTDPLEPDFEKQLADEGISLEGRERSIPAKPVVEPKPEDKKPDEPVDKTPEPDKTKPEDKKPDESKPKSEPWRQKVAEKHQAKAKEQDEEITRLRKENEDLKKNPKPDAPSKPADQDKTADNQVLSKEQKDLAEKYGIEEADYLKMFPTKVIEREVVKNGLSPDQEKMLNKIQTDAEQSAITQGYNDDFNKNVLSLIKAEYPSISEDKIAEIKSKIFDKIQTPEYSMTPLDTLYKGDDEFRGVVNIPKKTVDSGSKVPAIGGNKVYDFENVTETDMKAADFPFEKYSNYMESKERGAKRN